MKLRVIILIVLFQATNVYSQPTDTLSIENFIRLFNNEHISEFDFGWSPFIASDEFDLNLDLDLNLSELKIKLENGEIVDPNIYGWPYSYKRFQNEYYWFVTYSLGEGGYSYILHFVNVNTENKRDKYLLASAGGDSGFWGYKNGIFINDSTYSYTIVGGEDYHTNDSIIGKDIIRPNGEINEIEKRNFKE